MAGGGGGGRYHGSGRIERRNDGIGGRQGRLRDGMELHHGGVHAKTGHVSSSSNTGKIRWRGRRFGRGGFRMNASGELFAPETEDEEGTNILGACVPDSKDEGAGDDVVNLGLEIEDAGKADGDSGVQIEDTGGENRNTVIEIEDSGVDGIAEAAVGMEVAANVAAALEVDVDAATEATVVDSAGGLEVPPEVTARINLAVVGVDEVYHSTFLSMLEILLPALFVP